MRLLLLRRRLLRKERRMAGRKGELLSWMTEKVKRMSSINMMKSTKTMRMEQMNKKITMRRKSVKLKQKKS